MFKNVPKWFITCFEYFPSADTQINFLEFCLFSNFHENMDSTEDGQQFLRDDLKNAKGASNLKFNERIKWVMTIELF